MLEFTHIGDLTSEEVDRIRAVYQPLAESVRDLIDATIRTEVDADEVAAAKAEIDALTTRLRARQSCAFGVRYTTAGDRMAWGNKVRRAMSTAGCRRWCSTMSSARRPATG